MDSDLDSDGSHISSTPPRDPPDTSVSWRTQPLMTLLSSTKERTKVSASAATTSRLILKPKVSRINSKPKPNSELNISKSKPVESQPQIVHNLLSSLPLRIKEPDNLQSYKNASEFIIPGGQCTPRFASIVSSRGKDLNFQPDVSIQPKGEGFSVRGADIEEVKVQAVAEGITKRKGIKGLNLIGGNGPDTVTVKKPKYTSEGNFVKLNINGYGRKKFRYINKKNSCSKSSRRWKFNRKSKENRRVGGEDSGVFDEEGLAVDVKEGEIGSCFGDSGLIVEAVMKVRNEASEKHLLNLLKLTHGYDSFRNGQLDAIKMMLNGNSTMLLLPTGAGKSLCYQLPALVFPGVTLVVSPLVALMIDQLKHLPPSIPGGLLSSSQTAEQASETLRSLQEGGIKVLYVSPERFLNEEFMSIFSSTSMLSLVVIDEAHCVSEWSHNFRPAYMRLRGSLLHGRLNARCILAMTATATTRTLHDIMHALEIPATNLINLGNLRENLHLSISMSGNRMKDLMALIKSSPFSDIKSIIIYCKYQHETDTISRYLCDNNISSKSYHSGIPAKDRSRTQDLFCSNKIKVVVATVAFGMGLDKRDVGAVIHYCLPESLEEYVQEIGRAGRDGRASYCHLFFDHTSYSKLRSLIYSDGVDEYAINKLLCQIFMSGRHSDNQICSLVKESSARKFDMKEEVILTILTQLELGEVQYIHLLPQITVSCTLNFHQTSPALLAGGDPVVGEILKKAEVKDGQYLFDIPCIATSLRMEPLNLSNHLQCLKLKGEITYELKDQAYCYRVLEVPKDICSLAADLAKWLREIETCKVQKIDAAYNAAVFATKFCDKSQGCYENQHTACLQRKILEYFTRDADADVLTNRMDQNSPFLRADVKVFLRSNSHAKFTPRAIARIFHGLSSPAFPSATWSRTHFWGRYAEMDFEVVMEAAKAELMNFVGKDVI
ncbi:ATP-dependent DNA helicase Q-like 5-like [Dorcoceras hygrometricum]|uniref:DNA 3'-5' helicase n=1 Tax=Dorcoceras hygrometricum TaxID=472368 RepID=A0A2Z7C026_9LAMI|nr:ATP-dependent DNA helicase Q-like 5-like [Dorcoceras hygrometricum]